MHARHKTKLESGICLQHGCTNKPLKERGLCAEHDLKARQLELGLPNGRKEIRNVK